MSVPFAELCCRTDELVGGSLVDKLIEIDDRYTEANDKSIEWVENLKCLSVVHGSSNTLRETRVKVKDMNAVRDYIAVSYSCEPMEEYEDAESKGYTIKTEDGQERKNEVRDVVIFRVRRFAEHVGSSLFWIDKECIDSTKKCDKQAAMDSMDRVYHKSKHPLGLISTEIRDESHVSSLASLLRGNLVQDSRRGAPSMLANCDNKTITSVLDLLEVLQKDRWWQRAWIFQEEYLGGERMTLLIRHTQHLELPKREAFARDSDDKKGHYPVDFIDGEIHFSATLLRKQTTKFLLALCDCIDVPSALQERCDLLLSCFSKYKILYDETEANGKAMSTMIFADIAARDIGQPYDILPIAANCCNYGARLDSQALAEEGSMTHSVGLCALTMYLVNGELIHDVEEITELPTSMSTSDYLEYISFCNFDPPVGRKQLTWLKDCRLPEVNFHQDGIHTVGLVWQVYDEFGVAGWRDPKPKADRIRHKYGLDDHQRDRLLQFAAKLRTAEDNGTMSRTSLIPEKIEEYLQEDLISQRSYPVKKYKDTMAREIVYAIDGAEQTLSLAVLEGSNEAFAVFVGPQNVDENARIFTSWSSKVDEDKRYRTRHVSLEVTLVDEKTPPLMRYTRWVNGLTFWRGHTQKEAIFCWPSRWKEVSRTCKRGA